MSDLLPCPFCGCEGFVERDYMHGATGAEWKAGCSKTMPDGLWDGCVTLAWYESESEAIAAWNRRAPVPPPVDAAEPTPAQIAVATTWEPPEDRQDGYRCLGWHGGQWNAVNWRSYSDYSEWTDDEWIGCNPEAFCPLPGGPGTEHTPAQIDLLCLSVQDVINGRLETGDAAADLAAVKEHLDTALKLTGFDVEAG
jgi:hypothetical protein